jgi:LmbE family N-acetylglucosaminyl deacetylase
MKTLVIAPHPDDEVFGCGGFIHRLKAAGSEVHVLYMTVGTTADFSAKGESTASERVAELERVVNYLRIDSYAIAFPGNEYHLQLDALPEKRLVGAIESGFEQSLQNLKPDLVLTTSTSDHNQDHRAVGAATLAALRPSSPEHKSFQPIVLTYELPYQQWNVTPTLPNRSLFVRLDDAALAAKLQALELYGSQLKSAESPLSVHGVRTLLNYRGLNCGGSAAEAFEIKRLVV